jgi:hypothetical protein
VPLMKNARPISPERGSHDQISLAPMEGAAGAREHRRFIGMLLLSVWLLLVGLSLSLSLGWLLLFLFLHATAATTFRHLAKPAVSRARNGAAAQCSDSTNATAAARATNAVATIAVEGPGRSVRDRGVKPFGDRMR